MNELAELKFEIDFKPSEITIKNEDELKQLIDKTTNFYQSLVFTDDNTDEAKKARADLNKVIKKIDDERKTVKREYNSPLKEFEGKLNNYTRQLKNVTDTISDSLNEFEEKQRKNRENEILSTIDEMAPSYEIENTAIGINPSWLNKTAFTTKGKPTKKTIEEIAGTMKQISDEQKQIKSDKAVIANYAKAVDMDPESWTSLITTECRAPEVMKKIDQAVANRNERLKQEEDRRKKQEEYELAMAKLKEEQEEKVADKTVNTETGEIVKEEPKLQSVVLKITGTNEQFVAFNNFLIDNNIKVEEVKM